MRRVHTLLSLVAFFLLSLYVYGNVSDRLDRKSDRPLRERLVLEEMGYIPISISVSGLSKEELSAAVGEVKGEILELIAMSSKYDPDSEISRLNRGELHVHFSRKVWDLVNYARKLSDLTNGAFDISVGPLEALWKRSRDAGRVPSEDELRAALALVGNENYSTEIQGEGRFVVRLEKKGVRLDLGGLSKGWFAEVAADLLRRSGAKRLVVDVGGDMALWDSDEGAEFEVGIRDPDDPERLFAVLRVPSGAVATSGGYFRFLEIEGRKYPHIVDPRTGRANSDVLSVTVVAKDGVMADALATAIFVMGSKDGMAFVEKSESLEAVIIRRSPGGAKSELLVSRGLVGRILLRDAVESGTEKLANAVRRGEARSTFLVGNDLSE